jgi:hypothetical protein
MSLPKLKITGDNPAPESWHIWIDGHKIGGITRLTLYLDADDITTATIEITPEEVEVEGEALLELVARVKAKGQAA